ncbi:MAG: glycosyltransferase family 4 protein [Candidatus Goldbacteria bacterium]|nr:glycosyltransferase family 4 protein [Candidatus Goldiibacteriota bacterium]
MNIAINGRVLTERKGGPYRYTVNVIRELSKIDKKNKYYLFVNADINLDFSLNSNFDIIIKKTKSKLYFDYFYLPAISHRYNIDIWLFPKNTFSPMIKGKKVPVFHDIVYFEKGLHFREFNYFDNLHHKLMIPINGKISAVNIAVSNFTAQRMQDLLKIPAEKISIIKEGVEEVFFKKHHKKQLQSIIKKYNLKLPYFFYSGSLSPRKNMLNVLKAFNCIKDTLPHNLYVTGGYSWRDNEVFEFIKDNKLENRVIKLGYIPDEDLVGLYKLADCYLYPSLYEGFGLPILEAQACGCPVITSNVSSCPEVAGDGALIVDPYNVKEIADAMELIVKNPKLKNKLIQAGKKNVRKYSWEICAREMVLLFERINSKID